MLTPSQLRDWTLIRQKEINDLAIAERNSLKIRIKDNFLPKIIQDIDHELKQAAYELKNHVDFDALLGGNGGYHPLIKSDVFFPRHDFVKHLGVIKDHLFAKIVSHYKGSGFKVNDNIAISSTRNDLFVRKNEKLKYYLSISW